MTVELLQTLSLISFIVAGVLFLVGVALFFLLDVPKVYGDVSGRTAKKAIESIRQQNESSGNKAYKPSPVNAERGKLTDKITQSGRLEPRTGGLAVSVGTEKFATSTLAPQPNETTVLDNNSGETTVLETFTNETTVLSVEAESVAETTILSQDTHVNNVFSVEVEMSFAESSEIIE